MKKFFPSLNKYNYIFCENAGGSQIPYQVINKSVNFLKNNYLQPSLTNKLSKKLQNDVDEIYKTTNIILNNKEGKIFFASSTSQLSYNLANSLEEHLSLNKNNEIILNDFNHEACLTPFERIANKNNLKIKFWKLDNFNINYNNLFKNINNNTSLIVLPHASNILGNQIDLKYITNKIKNINPNTLVLADGVANMPHDIIDVEDYNIDFYLVSFYKFCGMRISTLYCKKDNEKLLKNQNHYFLEDNVNKKLDLGGINFETAYSILGLKDYLLDIDNNKQFTREIYCNIMTKLINYENTIINILSSRLKNNSEIDIVECKLSKKIPIFSIKFKNYNLHNVSLILNELGIICKNSTFYCDRFFDNYKLDKSLGLLRISLMHYNTISDVNKITDYINLFKKLDLNYIFGEYKFNIDSLPQLQNSFNKLPRDKYYTNTRNRAFSLLKVNNSIEVIGNLNFYQSSQYNNYNGNLLREYDNISNYILNNNSFKDIIFTFNNIVSKKSNKQNNYIQIHKIRVYANKNLTNLIPEGIHQDGFNMIAICCISRKNIKGGINRIYDINKNIIYSKQLEEGEMIIINDIKNYHDVTNIELIDKEKIGYRDIIVLTTIG